MPRVLNKRTASAEDLKGAIYVGRPSDFGNPFVIGKDGDREEVIRKYTLWLLERPALVAKAKRLLAGKDLVCWCAPEACHADVLLAVANNHAGRL